MPNIAIHDSIEEGECDYGVDGGVDLLVDGDRVCISDLLEASRELILLVVSRWV